MGHPPRGIALENELHLCAESGLVIECDRRTTRVASTSENRLEHIKRDELGRVARRFLREAFVLPPRDVT